jgi:transcription factor C subunit 3
MRLQDLKTKLGVLGMRWQMKVVSKICRFLSARGAIEYVAAKLDNRIFKDCIRFNRDLNARDWSIFLATGKRGPKWAKCASHDQPDDELILGTDSSPRRIKRMFMLARCPLWSVDVPLSTYISNALWQFNHQGLTNQDICGMTIGQTFSRYISGLTVALSAAGVQPPHLQHLCVINEHIRTGKVASFLYFIGSIKPESGHSGSSLRSPDSPERTGYGFYRLDGDNHIVDETATLSELCQRGLTPQRKRGRPQKSTFRDVGELATQKSLDTVVSSDENIRQHSATMPEKNHPSTMTLENTAPGQSTDIERVTDYTNLSHQSDVVGGKPTNFTMEENELSSPMAPTETLAGRGRGRAGKATVYNNADLADDNDQSRPFKCGKCGGSWKNDAGLKYHLEKSKTACNHSYKSPAPRNLKKQKRQKVSVSERQISGTEGISLVAAQKTREVMTTSQHAPPKALRTAFRSSSHLTDHGATSQQRLLTHDNIRPRQIADMISHSRSSRPRKAVHISEKPIPLNDLTANHSTIPWKPAPDDLNSDSSVTAPAAALRKKNSVPDPPRNSKSPNYDIEQVVQKILHDNGGCVPGGPPLELLFAEAWRAHHFGKSRPGTGQLGSVIRRMLRQKTITEHWHAFRARNGVLAKCQIIMFPTFDAFSEEAVRLVDRIKEIHPESIDLSRPLRGGEDATPDKKVGGRGRRLLASDVAILDAPVYAAQAAAKRGAEVCEEMSHSTKKRRIQDDYDESTFRSSSPTLTARDFWPTIGNKIPNKSSVLDLYSFLTTGLAMQIDTLAFSHNEHRGLELMPAGTLSLNTCKGLARALPRHGWLPNSDWYSWASAYKPSQAQQSKTSTEESKYRFFVEALQLCAKVEEGGISTTSGTLSSHTRASFAVFVNFVGGTDMTRYPSVQWANVGELERDLPSTVHVLHDDEESCYLTDVEQHPNVHGRSNLATDQSRAGIDMETKRALARIKRVALATRRLGSLPEDAEPRFVEGEASLLQPEFDLNEVMAAFVAVRTLLGGVEKAIDWGVLLALFPGIGLAHLRRFWATARKERAAYISKFTESFQDRVIQAFRDEELPMLDYSDPQSYDWKGLIQWTMRMSNQEKIQMPSSRKALSMKFDLMDCEFRAEDWREKFFHPQTSIFARFEAATLEAGALSLLPEEEQKTRRDNVDVARSWVRSLCCTGETKYSPQDVKGKFSSLSNSETENGSSSLRKAIDELTKERVICKSKKAPFGGRPYRLNESYIAILSKISHSTKYREAAEFKAKLDLAFRRRGSARVSYTLEDGAVMALINLSAVSKVRIKTVKVPKIPFGFEPGNYETRKYPKSYYHLTLQVEPTEFYEYTGDIDTLRLARETSPPSMGAQRKMPQWIDFFGELDANRWADLLGAFCFVLSIRGPMTLDCICNAVAPVLEDFETQLIGEWGLATGILRNWEAGPGITIGEWWWLAVDTQRQVSAGEH